MKSIRSEKILILIAIAWYMLTAFFSNGYYHADEHYQVIEFAGVKSGKVNPNELAWEYREMVRPALQPVLASIIFNISDKACMQDPYTKSLILRIITALFALWAIYTFTLSCRTFIPKGYWNLFVFLSFFLWFLPFLNVRFSSESWSGLFLLLTAGMSIVEVKKSRHFLLLGIFAGLSFAFRFQSVTAIIGILLWLVIIRKERIVKLALSLSLILLVVIGSSLLDCWFYETQVFVPWEYFRANMLEGIASSFGTSPWYYYFYYIFRFGFFPIGMLIILSLVYMIVRNPKSLLTWIIVPFLLLHSLVPHKEVRFLFPLVNFVPAFFILLFAEIGQKRFVLANKRIFLLLGWVLFFVNLIGVVTASLKPAGIGRMEITSLIHKQGKKEIRMICYTESNPYEPWNGLKARFYEEDNLNIQKIGRLSELDSLEVDKSQQNILIIKSRDLKDLSIQHFIERSGMSKKGQSIPPSLMPLLKLYGGFPAGDVLILYSDRW
jgi:GPI mannosyltransferase 3